LAVDLAPTPSADGVSPAPVLHPAFDAARQHGYLTDGDGQLELTEVGQREIDKLVGATHRWLADELTDWGAADDELVTRALDNMANQFIDQDPQLLPAPEVLRYWRAPRELLNRRGGPLVSTVCQLR
jgi:hypothetical protein